MDSKAQLTVDIIAKVAERKITIVHAIWVSRSLHLLLRTLFRPMLVGNMRWDSWPF